MTSLGISMPMSITLIAYLAALLKNLQLSSSLLVFTYGSCYDLCVFVAMLLQELYGDNQMEALQFIQDIWDVRWKPLHHLFADSPKVSTFGLIVSLMILFLHIAWRLECLQSWYFRSNCERTHHHHAGWCDVCHNCFKLLPRTRFKPTHSTSNSLDIQYLWTAYISDISVKHKDVHAIRELETADFIEVVLSDTVRC
jgi:hypothetical protein